MFFFLPLPLPWCFHHSASSSALRLAAADFARAIRSPDKRRLSRLTAILSKLSPDGLRELFGMNIGIPGGISTLGSIEAVKSNPTSVGGTLGGLRSAASCCLFGGSIHGPCAVDEEVGAYIVRFV